MKLVRIDHNSTFTMSNNVLAANDGMTLAIKLANKEMDKLPDNGYTLEQSGRWELSIVCGVNRHCRYRMIVPTVMRLDDQTIRTLVERQWERICEFAHSDERLEGGRAYGVDLSTLRQTFPQVVRLYDRLKKEWTRRHRTLNG